MSCRESERSSRCLSWRMTTRISPAVDRSASAIAAATSRRSCLVKMLFTGHIVYQLPLAPPPPKLPPPPLNPPPPPPKPPPPNPPPPKPPPHQPPRDMTPPD